MLTEVYCTLQVEGLHFWKNCPLDEVYYLKYPHRHLFKITAYKKVVHNNRDQEFICLKHEILKFLRKNYFDDKLYLHDFGEMSCEMISDILMKQFDLSKCNTSEDGENGSIVVLE